MARYIDQLLSLPPEAQAFVELSFSILRQRYPEFLGIFDLFSNTNILLAIRRGDDDPDYFHYVFLLTGTVEALCLFDLKLQDWSQDSNFPMR